MSQQWKGNGCVEKAITGNSLVVQWLRLYASTAGGASLILGGGTKIPILHSEAKKKLFKNKVYKRCKLKKKEILKT